MTGEEHEREAERLLAEADLCGGLGGMFPERAKSCESRAQTHAMLALRAALVAV